MLYNGRFFTKIVFSMRILALDTSTEYCSLALFLDGQTDVRDVYAGQRHSEICLPLIEDMLSEAGIALSSLDGIAFGSGPGSFTGLRIACGVAQGLAFAADLPVAPIGTLDALAHAVPGSRVVACIDARMGQVYHAAFARDARGQFDTVYPPGLYHPDEVPALEGSGWYGVGTGFRAYQAALTARYGMALDGVEPERMPRARDMAELAVQVFARGDGIDPALASPLYVRDRVALKTSER